MSRDRPAPLILIQKPHQFPQFLPDAFKLKNIIYLPKFIRLNFLYKIKFFFYLRNTDLARQQTSNLTKHLFRSLKRRHLFHRSQHQTIHKIVKPFSQLIFIIQMHQRRNML